MAVSDVNAAGGVLGEPVRLVAVDDFCDAEQAAAAARVLVSAGVMAVIGHQCSGAAVAASEIYATRNLPLISAGATNPRVTERGLKNVFRVSGRDDVQGSIIVEYLAKRASRSGVAIIQDIRLVGHGLADEVHRQLTARGITPVLIATVEPDQVDFGSLVNLILTSATGTILFSGYAVEGGLLVRTSRAAGYRGAFVGDDPMWGEAFWVTGGEAAEGVLLTYYPQPPDAPMAKPLVERLRTINAELPETFRYRAYAAVQVWAEAARRAGTAAPDRVVAILHEASFDTVLGRLGFDARGDVTGVETFTWYRWTNGHHERIGTPSE